MAAARTIHVKAGEPYAHVVTFTDADGNLCDTTGWTIGGAIRTHAHRTAPLVAEFGVNTSALAASAIAVLSLTADQADEVARRFDTENVGAWGAQVTVNGSPYIEVGGPVTAEGDVSL